MLTSDTRGLRAEERADFIFEEIGASVIVPTILVIGIVEVRIPLVYPPPVCSCLNNLS